MSIAEKVFAGETVSIVSAETSTGLISAEEFINSKMDPLMSESAVAIEAYRQKLKKEGHGSYCDRSELGKNSIVEAFINAGDFKNAADFKALVIMSEWIGSQALDGFVAAEASLYNDNGFNKWVINSVAQQFDQLATMRVKQRPGEPCEVHDEECDFDLLRFKPRRLVRFPGVEIGNEVNVSCEYTFDNDQIGLVTVKVNPTQVAV